MTGSRNLTVGILLIVAAVAFYGVSTMTRTSDAPPAPAAFAVPGSPAGVYEAILPEIRDRVARETKVVRVDSPQGAITIRFSAPLEDRSVRLVEVELSPADGAATEVTLLSQRFSFLPGRRRDAQDVALEATLAELIRNRTAPQP